MEDATKISLFIPLQDITMMVYNVLKIKKQANARLSEMSHKVIEAHQAGELRNFSNETKLKIKMAYAAENKIIKDCDYLEAAYSN